MEIGKRNKRIEFGMFKVKTNNGIREKKWHSEFRSWAAVNNLYGREFWEAKAQQSEKTVKFNCRYDRRINPKLYIKLNENFYEIVGEPDNIGYKNIEVEIKAKILERDKIE